MLKFILRRCLEAIPTLFILITISFFMMRLAPGSPFTGERTLPPEVMANIEAKYHLNDPISTQYFNYLKQLAHGDFGPSFKYKAIPLTPGGVQLPCLGETGCCSIHPCRRSRRHRGRYCRAQTKYQMGLYRNGGGDDRGGYTQLRCRAITGDDICHYAQMAARRRLERWGAEVHDFANGGTFPGLYRQYRAYHPRFHD